MIDVLTDEYDRKARLAPAVIVLLPLAVGLLLWTSANQRGLERLSGLGATALVTMALSVLLAALVRGIGKSREKALWAQWGGPPTTALLRHGNSEILEQTRDRYHQKLSALGVNMPSREEQQENPQQADESYQSAVDILISKTRDVKTFPLVFRENVNYGFHRNLWALRRIGIGTSLFGNISSLLFLHNNWDESRTVELISLGGLLVCTGLLYVWTFVVNAEWVRTPAVAYARAVLGCCDSIDAQVT